MTPPATPVRTRDAGLSKATTLPDIPPVYAVKEPSSRSARRVLSEECRVFSYLSRYSDADKYLVPFYGQDSRSDALIMGLMDGTLENWMQAELKMLDEETRTAKLALAFPCIAMQLIDGLVWLQNKECTHGDIKPTNTLIATPPSSSIPHVVYTDFSSATLRALQEDSTDADGSKPKAPLGGGTWDFLDPVLTNPAVCTHQGPATDLWALAMTLLILILGTSPFACAANSFQRRALIKTGDPLLCATYELRNVKRIAKLSAALGWDVQKWFRLVLVKETGKRVDAGEWRAELERCCVVGASGL